MEVLLSFVILIVFLGTTYPMMDVPDGTVKIYQGMAGSENLSLDETVDPLSKFKDQNIIKQEYDYSCGSAALAMILNYYLGEKFGEQQVIQGMMQYGEAAKIEKRRAFSLLDMKRFVEVLGYEAAGYKAEFEDLVGLGKPAIVPIEFSGYRHFVVLRGIYNDHVFVADPYMGNTSHTIRDFIEMWTQKIVFVVSSKGVTLNALALSNEDLRIVDIPMDRSDAMDVLDNQEMIRQQQDVIESLDIRVYKRL